MGEPDQSTARPDPAAEAPEPPQSVGVPISTGLGASQPVHRKSMLEAGVDCLVRTIALTMAAAMSLLPVRWRERVSWSHSLPLVSGTGISAFIQGGVGVWLVVHVYRSVLGHGLLAGMVEHSGVFIATGVFLFLEAGARFLSALALSEPLGTLPLWLVERTLFLLTAGRRAARERGWDAPLPRARLIRRR